jgi:hypothetical protein
VADLAFRNVLEVSSCEVKIRRLAGSPQRFLVDCWFEDKFK